MSPQIKIGFLITRVGLMLLPAGFAHSIEYAGQISADYRISDNAYRVADDQEQEAVTEYGGTVSLTDSSKYHRANLNYGTNRSEYSEKKEDNRTHTTGNGSLSIHDVREILSLTVSHSRQLTLVDEFGNNDSENTNERTIITASPSIRLGLTKLDNVILSYIFSEIRLKEQAEKNSERRTGALQWIHRLSNISEMGFQYSKSDIEFDDFKYTYENFTLDYSSALRSVSYYVNVGYNKSYQDDDTFDSPRYDFGIEYAKAKTSFGLDVSSSMTDTSLGNNSRSNNIDEIGEPNEVNRDHTSSNTDVYYSKTANVYLNTSIFEPRLNHAFLIGVTDEDYWKSDEDSTSKFASYSMDYKLTRNTNIEYKFGYWNIISQSDDEKNTINRQHSIAYSGRPNQKLTYRVYLTRDSWVTKVQSLNYIEHYLGVGLIYNAF